MQQEWSLLGPFKYQFNISVFRVYVILLLFVFVFAYGTIAPVANMHLLLKYDPSHVPPTVVQYALLLYVNTVLRHYRPTYTVCINIKWYKHNFFFNEICSKSLCLWYYNQSGIIAFYVLFLIISFAFVNQELCHVLLFAICATFCIHCQNRHEGFEQLNSNMESFLIMRTIMKEITEASNSILIT